jgi:hypothetical protein
MGQDALGSLRVLSDNRDDADVDSAATDTAAAVSHSHASTAAASVTAVPSSGTASAQPSKVRRIVPGDASRGAVKRASRRPSLHVVLQRLHMSYVPPRCTSLAVRAPPPSVCERRGLDVSALVLSLLLQHTGSRRDAVVGLPSSRSAARRRPLPQRPARVRDGAHSRSLQQALGAIGECTIVALGRPPPMPRGDVPTVLCEAWPPELCRPCPSVCCRHTALAF